jgi:hypothetical protein
MMRSASFCLVTLIVFAAGVAPAYSQNQKSIEWPKDSMNNSRGRSGSPDLRLVDRIEQIEVEAIQVEGQSITIGEPFPASDEWLWNAAFRVKNVSGRELKFVQITLVLPEITEGSPQLPFVCNECRVGRQQIPIAPGSEIELRIPPTLYEWAKGIISQKSNLANITRAKILAVSVKTPDDLNWSSDCVKTRDEKSACTPLSKP